jgi:hypothetical protein
MIIFIGKSCLQIIRSSDYTPNNAFIFIMLWFVFPFLFILLKKKQTFIFIHFVIFNNNFCFNFTVLPSYTLYIYISGGPKYIVLFWKLNNFFVYWDKLMKFTQFMPNSLYFNKNIARGHWSYGFSIYMGVYMAWFTEKLSS